MYSKDGCMKTSSNCVIWEGPDIPCLKLCKGDTITEVLFKLATKFCDTLVMLDPSKYDISCFNYIGCPPEDFAELFQIVIDQICNIQLTPGPAGPAGADGEDGENGNYVVVNEVLIGSPFCPCGGIEIQLFSGITNTVINQYYACNGCDGTPGAIGTQGPQGVNGSQGVKGDPGNAGTDGKSGRGVAVFVQTTQPTSTDFNSLYGSVDGFGVNNLPGNNQIRPGDLWIEPCNP